MIGERIKAARIERGLKQAELAGDEFSRSYISELENNRRKPSAETIQVLARRLGKPLDYFLQDEQQEVASKANLLINQAFAQVGMQDIAAARKTLAPVQKVHKQLPEITRARYHEILAWMEQAENRALSSINHALLAESLYAELDAPSKQWYCLHVGAHASYMSSLYEQTVELGHRALLVVSRIPALQSEKRLTLNLLGNAYYALGRLDLAEQHYSEALSCDEQNDVDILMRLYHGKSLCAEQQGRLAEALLWAEQACAISRQKRAGELHARNEVNRGLCLIRLGRLDDAMKLLHEQLCKHDLSKDFLRLACGDYLLSLSSLEPYPDALCIPLESKLEELTPEDSPRDTYLNLRHKWAIAKSRLRRSQPEEIRPIVKLFADQFASLSHKRRSAEVLEFGAKLLEQHGDIRGAYELLKRAVELK